MHIQKGVSLSNYSAMRLGGQATSLVTVNNLNELVEALNWAEQNNQQIKVIGYGTNIVWQDTGFNGLVVVNKMMGLEISEDGTVKAGAGENWDSVVKRAVEQGWSGLECLSAIPGTAGATPVQNVGAYGQEIANVLTEVEVYDTVARKSIIISKRDCGFSYRNSRFKTKDKGRFVILSITLELRRDNPKPPFYESLQQYLDSNSINDYTSQSIRDAVVAIRAEKLPDPSKVANNGSFFINPVIDKAQAEDLTAKFPNLQSWPNGDRVKLSAAWLVEQAGFPKDFHDPETGMATWKNQALVLVNEHARSSADLLRFKQKIVSAVQQKLGITLEQEPELI